MKNLIIADIHERVWQLMKLEKQIDEADQVVSLGDWFDTFLKYDEGRVKATCEFLNQVAKLNKWRKLWGNHDTQYAFKHHAFKCSGYHSKTQAFVDELIPRETWESFKVYTEVGPYTLSHAGFHAKTMKYKDPEVCELAIKMGFAGNFHELWVPGQSRGGWFAVGGPNWLDWDQEFKPVEGMQQIVGHTPHENGVRWMKDSKGLKSWDLDTHSKHYAWIEDDKVEVVPLV